MNNKLIDLNNHLFAQLERLGDKDLKGEDLAGEINKVKAITGVAAQIVSNAALVLEAHKIADNAFDAKFRMPKMIGDENTGKA
ncbi:hypothetical protein [Acetobacterium sp.]|uniref:hypothetical protein n=1 Tax=Acetobacterium sp. TaxID=1872094 RepID=UPI002F403105